MNNKKIPIGMISSPEEIGNAIRTKRIVDAAEEVASEQQAKWGPASIIGRIQKVIARQVKHTQ